MKEAVFSERVLERLSEFETMQNVQQSAGWKESLMNRLASARHHSTSNLPSAGFTIAVLFIILINLGFILNSIFNNSLQFRAKDKELQVISKELLINPIAINN